MFPYPSGTAMHVWHASNFLINEIVARYQRMKWNTVVFPIWYDSFWLPTENYAIKNNKSARQATEENIKYFEEQLAGIDFSFDKDRTFKTSDPEYYKRTQWIFTKLYQHNLVYRKDWLVNWCNGCQTVLANDQVVDGKCERCETEIIQKKHQQWYIKITDYADQLLDYSDCDRPEETKVHQTNWIGKSWWCEADFAILTPDPSPAERGEQVITVFTTRIDTIYWVTAIVIAPENDIIDQYMTDAKKSELANYRKTTALKTNIERQSTDKDKTWFDSGVQVIHPLTGELVPVWFADYVLPDYATGAVMFVPAHDERDREFAHKYDIAIKKVIAKETGTKRDNEQFADGGAWVVFDPQSQQYAVAQFADGRLLLFAGGVNPWETVYDAILREVQEESGLYDFAYSEHIETSYAHYYNTAKQINRYARAECLLIILNSTQTNATGLEDHEKFTLTWKSAQEILTNWNERNTDGSLDHYIRFFTESVARAIRLWYDKTSDTVVFKGEAYTGVGILENSWIFSWMANTTAKTEITKHLESIGKGKAKTTYRLRDWSVSRQRYWGSPIPVYYTFEDNQKVPYFTYSDPVWWVKHEDWVPFITRKTVQAVLKDPQTNMFCVLKRKIDGTYSFPLGWVEEWETSIEAATREIKEETWYENIKYVSTLSEEYHKHFYHPNKKRNQYNIESLLFFELIDNNHSELSDKEKSIHEVQWLTLEQLKALDAREEHDYFCSLLEWSQYQWPITDRYNAYNPHPDKSKWIPHLIPESDLPVILPLDLPNYKPAGKSPLEDHPSFKYYRPGSLSGGEGGGEVYLRECDTLDTFMCSSFYFLRFCDPHNPDQLISPEAAKLMPVDLYVWGKEHTVWHLLYSRFIYKFLRDIGAVACESKEPFHKLVHQGMVHASDGRKMSKRWGNVIDPMTIINEYGSDTLRTYVMFMGPVEASKNWNPDAVAWVHRFLGRVAKLKDKIAAGALFDKEGAEWSEVGDLESSVSSLDSSFNKGASSEILSTLHQTIKWVSEDIEALKFNTAVSKLMIMSNAFAEASTINQSDYLIFLQLCAPFATQMSQKLRSDLGQEGSVHDSARPQHNENLIMSWFIDLPIQVNGKMRGTIEITAGATQDEVIALVRWHDTIGKRLNWEIIKVIYVQDKICNIIVK
jgi:leucyl-tRNA synthetase/ADP-ribose pyrophosphatase YjhB (NUDIX family)